MLLLSFNVETLLQAVERSSKQEEQKFQPTPSAKLLAIPKSSQIFQFYQ